MIMNTDDIMDMEHSTLWMNGTGEQECLSTTPLSCWEEGAIFRADLDALRPDL